MPSGISLVAKKFGSLRVEQELKCDVYVCECSCGSTITVFRSQLTKGSIRHCGCKFCKRHRHKRRTASFGHCLWYIGRDGRSHVKQSAEYLSWAAMKNRCLYPTNCDYENYGARGIRICQRWLEPRSRGFRNFLEDMGPRPVGKTLDRKDVNGHYCKQNCRWADASTQIKNRRFMLFPDGVGEPPVKPFDEDTELACW
jgi:hypothetical protein